MHVLVLLLSVLQSVSVSVSVLVLVCVVGVCCCCEEVRVVKRVHTLIGGVRRLARSLKVVEEVQEEVQEIRDEWENEEVEENGDQGRGETLITCVDEMTCATPFSHAVQCES